MRYQFKQGQKLPPQFRQIICLVKVGRDTRTRYCGCGRFQPIRSVLIHGIYSFEDGFRAATAASLGAPSSMDKYENAWHSVAKPPRRRSGISREMSLSMRVPLVACNELAIVTKSIAFALPHAERTPWVPFQGGTAVGETHEEGGHYNKSNSPTLLKRTKKALSDYHVWL